MFTACLGILRLETDRGGNISLYFMRLSSAFIRAPSTSLHVAFFFVAFSTLPLSGCNLGSG